jgi:hypothetical protein
MTAAILASANREPQFRQKVLDRLAEPPRRRQSLAILSAHGLKARRRKLQDWR